MKSEWIKSKWAAKDLHGKTVFFRVAGPDDSGRSLKTEGIGTFHAVDRPMDELIRIEIHAIQSASGVDTIERIFSIPQSAEALIRRCSGARADFELIDPSL